METDRTLVSPTAGGEQGYDNHDDLYCHATTCGCDECADNENIEDQALVEPPRRTLSPDHPVPRPWAAIADALRRYNANRIPPSLSRRPHNDATRRQHELQMMNLVNASDHLLTQ